jgi:hypothetical protein
MEGPIRARHEGSAASESSDARPLCGFVPARLNASQSLPSISQIADEKRDLPLDISVVQRLSLKQPSAECFPLPKPINNKFHVKSGASFASWVPIATADMRVPNLSFILGIAKFWTSWDRS